MTSEPDFGFGERGRLELYSITIEELDEKRKVDLRTITFENPEEDELLYERDDEEEIPIGKPLSLNGPSRPASPFDRPGVVFGHPNKSRWRLYVDYDEEENAGRLNEVVTEYVKDGDSKSGALVCFELLEKAVDATLLFTYVDTTEERVMRITNGEIYATTSGLENTKRLLRSFGACETSLIKKKSRHHPEGGEEEELYFSEPVTLDKSMLGMPLTEELHVTVNLNYHLVPFVNQGNSPQDHYTIAMMHRFPVPDSPGTYYCDFYDDKFPDAKLNLKVIWSDDLASRLHARLKQIAHNMEKLPTSNRYQNDFSAQPFSVFSQDKGFVGEKRRKYQ